MQRGKPRVEKKGSFTEEVIKRILAHRPKQAVVNSEALQLIDRITNAHQFQQVLSLLDEEGKRDLLKKSKPAQWVHVHDDTLAKSSIKSQLINSSGAPYPNEKLKQPEKFFLVQYCEFGSITHLYENAQSVFLSNNKECVKSQYMIAPLMWTTTNVTVADNIATNYIRITRDAEQMVQISRLISNTESRVDYVKNWGNYWIPKTEGKKQKVAVLSTYLSTLLSTLCCDLLFRQQQNTADMLAELTVALEIYGSLIETVEDMVAIKAAVENVPGANKIVHAYCARRLDLPEEVKLPAKHKLPDPNDIRLRRSFDFRCVENPENQTARSRK